MVEIDTWKVRLYRITKYKSSKLLTTAAFPEKLVHDTLILRLGERYWLDIYLMQFKVSINFRRVEACIEKQAVLNNDNLNRLHCAFSLQTDKQTDKQIIPNDI